MRAQSGWHPLLWNQCLNLTGPLRRQPRERVLEISIRIMPVDARWLDQAHDRRRPLAAAQRPGKQSVRSPKRPRPDQVLELVVVDVHSTIFQVARERCPAFMAVSRVLAANPRAQVRVEPIHPCNFSAMETCGSCRSRQRSSSPISGACRSTSYRPPIECKACSANWLLFAACRSKNLRRAWAMQPISVIPNWKLALYPAKPSQTNLPFHGARKFRVFSQARLGLKS